MGKKLVYSLALAASLPLFSNGCASTTTRPASAQASWMDKVSSSVKSGSEKMAAAVSPKPSSADPLAAPSNHKPGPNVFVAMAQMSERSGQLDEAEAKYKKALGIDPHHAGAMVGYAHLEDRRNHFEAATKLYQNALKKYPKEPSIHNDLGLCYHRRGMLSEATKELRHAVELKADNKLYRNNLAAVYVEQDKAQEALAQLIAAHGEPVGHYNLAYLLEQKHDHAAALVHFQKAADKDPSLVAAKQWVTKLSLAGSAASPPGNGPMIVKASPQANTAPNMSTAFATSPVVQAPPGTPQLVRASSTGGSTQTPSPNVRPSVETRGVQFPQISRSSNVFPDPIPPSPDQAQ